MLYIKITTLVLLSAFYLIYFGKMLMLKKQNIRGNILGKGEKSKGSYIAMHYASEGGYTEILEQLIIAGAEN